MKRAYKLFRVRSDGTLGPLFIGRDIVVPVGKFLKARAIRTKGFAFRPGWHCCARTLAPHLSKKGRVWCEVSVRGIKEHQRPASQGGLWYTANQLRVDKILWKDTANQIANGW